VGDEQGAGHAETQLASRKMARAIFRLAAEGFLFRPDYGSLPG
jgi:hypothetical protein